MFIGMILLPGCNKENKISVPISFTDKEGNIIIKIDTVTHSMDAYSKTKITQGRLKGIFNDTLPTSFYLAIISDPYWDTVYHARDTIVLPKHYCSHLLSMEAEIDLKDFSSPYHFLLVGIPEKGLKCGPHGSPSVIFTLELNDE
jgi:hypothetical protein